MANQCSHLHRCFEPSCNKVYTCDYPECQTLEGKQRLCARCSYLYGWRQNLERKSGDDFNVL
jgi:hypothetical protein